MLWIAFILTVIATFRRASHKNHVKWTRAVLWTFWTFLKDLQFSAYTDSQKYSTAFTVSFSADGFINKTGNWFPHSPTQSVTLASTMFLLVVISSIITSRLLLLYALSSIQVLPFQNLADLVQSDYTVYGSSNMKTTFLVGRPTFLCTTAKMLVAGGSK